VNKRKLYRPKKSCQFLFFTISSNEKDKLQQFLKRFTNSGNKSSINEFNTEPDSKI